ncbi:MAG: hypothetical protein P8123_05210, partial [bacterium]
MPNRGRLWGGVQCKGKDNYAGKQLTKTELIAEVEKAKSFRPRIVEYVIATTGQKDGKIEQIARELTKKHRKEGLFSVHVIAWKDIVHLMNDHPEIIEGYYQELSLNSKAIKEAISDDGKGTRALISQSAMEIKDSISSLAQEI